MALSSLGPAGAIISEFATNFIGSQRIDRLQDFVEQLKQQADKNESDLSDMKRRMETSVPYAALAEEVLLAAVKTPIARRRRDLAKLLRVGLGHDDAKLEGDLALLKLLEQLNEPQVIELMFHNLPDRSLGSESRAAFWDLHPGVFHIFPPSIADPVSEGDRWALREHYVDGLVSRGLLKYTDGIARPAGPRHAEITHLGTMLLSLIDRSAESDLAERDGPSQSD